MKNIEVTYTTRVWENGKCEEGEAAFILPMTDELAECYLTGVGMNRGVVNLVETALEAVEVMRGRIYIRSSIKDYREAKGSKTMKEKACTVSSVELPDGTPVGLGILTDAGVKAAAPFLVELFAAELNEQKAGVKNAV